MTDNWRHGKANGERRRACGRGAFTLVELLVTISIIAVLAGMLLSALSLARSSAQLTFCANNLRQIGQAMVMYENEERSLPLGNLPVALEPYDGNRRLYVCPFDKDPLADSYSPFYVCRDRQDTRHYLAGCHRHGSRGPVLYGQAVVQQPQTAPILDKHGDPVEPGTELSTEEVTFADGSTAKVTGSGSMVVLGSFRESDGRLYSLVKIKRDHLTQVASTVTPGSAYEVVTPAAVASALGTKYKVQTKTPAGNFRSELDVDEGVVDFRGRTKGGGAHRVAPGQSKQIEMPKNRCPLD